jgi:hypothetical protein
MSQWLNYVQYFHVARQLKAADGVMEARCAPGCHKFSRNVCIRCGVNFFDGKPS